MKFLHFLCILLLIAFISSCSKKTSEEKKIENPLKPNEVVVKYKDNEMTNVYKGCKPEDKNCTYIKLKWPQLTESKFKDSINLLIDKQVLNAYMVDSVTKFTDIKSMSKLFIDNYSTLKKKDAALPQWFVDCSVSIPFATSKLICLKTELSKFIGGANEVHTVNYIMLNQETGKPVALANLLKKDFGKGLTELLDKKFREMKKLTEKDSLTKAGLFKNEIKPPQNFAVTKEGIDFYYNPAEIAPKVNGEIVIKLSYADLADLISDDSLLK